MLEKLFQLSRFHTNWRTEVVAGMTTFLTMAYVIFVNPSMLAEAGMDHGAVFVATCIAAAIGCFLMGFWANLPIALAPGMGLNAFFTYSVVLGMGYSWQAALGAVFVSGVIFLILSVVVFNPVNLFHCPRHYSGLYHLRFLQNIGGQSTRNATCGLGDVGAAVGQNYFYRWLKPRAGVKPACYLMSFTENEAL